MACTPTTRPGVGAPSTGPADGDAALAATGKDLFAKFGCNACHGEQPGSAGLSPVNLYGSRLEQSDGTAALVDAAFVRESIVDPAKRLTRGYNNVMPTYKKHVDDAEIDAIVSYLKSVSVHAATRPAE